jgi:hypothetical protein
MSERAAANLKTYEEIRLKSEVGVCATGETAFVNERMLEILSLNSSPSTTKPAVPEATHLDTSTLYICPCLPLDCN